MTFMIAALIIVAALFALNWRVAHAANTTSIAAALPQFLQLALQPAYFFRAGIPALSGAALVLLTWGMGALKIMDYTDAQMYKKNVGLDFNLLQAVQNNWLPYWAWVTGAGLLAGIGVWTIGFWWYKKRLQWSGASVVDAQRLRRIYVLSEAWVLIAVVSYTLLSTLRYDNINAAWIGDHGASTALIGTAYFFSLYVSYFAVTAAFPVRRGRALFWFFFFPLLPSYFDLLSIVARLHD